MSDRNQPLPYAPFICRIGLTFDGDGQMDLSARGYHRVLKLARTIADLRGCEQIQAAHLAEVLQYRPKMM